MSHLLSQGTRARMPAGSVTAVTKVGTRPKWWPSRHFPNVLAAISRFRVSHATWLKHMGRDT